MIKYGQQNIDESDIDAVVSVLQSEFLTQGRAVETFEEDIVRYCGCTHAVSTNSATSALHIACLSLDVGPEDIVWTSPISFVASANCALYCGAKVDFVDIEKETGNISTEALSEKLESIAKQGGKLPKVLIAVHFGGQSCDMEALAKLASQYEFKIIEDASHAIGGDFKGEKIGSCKYSDMTIFSFHPVKVLTTGEGGMVCTNQRDLHRTLIQLRSHGVTRDPEFLTNDNLPPWYYEQQSLGFNYRMTDIQAALGSSQLKRLDTFLKSRDEVRGKYEAELSHEDLISIKIQPYNRSANHLYVILVDPKHRLDIFNQLRGKGIGVNVHYIPIYKQPFYRDLGFSGDYCPDAEAFYNSAITLPIHPSLTQTDQKFVIDSVNELVT